MTAAWTNPRTWVDGEQPTAAIMNAHLRDNVEYLADGLDGFARIGDILDRQVSVAGVGNATGNGQILFQYELPADTLWRDGMGLRVTFRGRLQENAASKQLKVAWGPIDGPSAAQPLDTGVNLTFGGYFSGRAWISRSSAGAQYAYARAVFGTAEPETFKQVVDRAIGAQDETAPILVSLLGFAPIGANQVYGHAWTVELIRVP